jgi:parvulin-like peptidyl-prolyl isomerase
MAKRRQQPKIENRREIALSKKESRERRKIFMAVGGLAALILVILAVGLVYTYLIEPSQPVAVVNGVEISRSDYQKRVLYERYLLDEQAALIETQFQQFAASLGEDASELLQSLKDQANQQLGQIYNQRLEMDRQALEYVIEDELVAAEATRQGITLSEEEVSETYAEIAAARSGGYTQAKAAETVTARQNATATAAQFTPTPTQEGEESASTPEPTSPPQPTPTINVISGGALDEAVKTWETTMLENTTMTPEDLRRLVRLRLLREKLIEVIGNEIDNMALQSHARHILVDTEEEALAAKTRLEAGAAFEEVAAEVSLDPGSATNGGDLGWFTQGTMIAPFDEAAFSLEIDEISAPIETQFGWHIIQVLGREERELNETDMARERSKAYSDWLFEAKSSGVEDLWDEGDAPPDDNNPFNQPAQNP